MTFYLSVDNTPDEQYEDPALDRVLKRFKDAVEAKEGSYVALEYLRTTQGPSA